MGGPHLCPMKITQDVREYASLNNLDAEAALTEAMKEKSATFSASGGGKDQSFAGSRDD